MNDKSLIKRLFASLLPTSKSTDPQHSKFIVTKDAMGEYRWFGWATNKWLDRDGEILTDAAHREFVKYLDENPDEAPELWTWHTPGTARANKADWWDYANGFMVYSGKLEETEAKAYLELEKAEREQVGMSHGFWVLERKGNLITRYRTFEVSELPLAKAANPFTDFQTINKENTDMFTPEKRQFLVDRYGEEKVAALESDTEGREKALTELGMTWKEFNESVEKEIADAEKERAVKAAEVIVKEVVAEVIQVLNVDGLKQRLEAIDEAVAKALGLSEQVAELEAAVNHLKETQDERLAKALAPVQAFDWNYSVQKEERKTAIETATETAKETLKEQLDWGFKSPLGGN